MNSRKFEILSIGIVCVLAAHVTLPASKPDAAEGHLYFERHVRPLLAKRCYSCHSQISGQREGGLLLDSRVSWAASGDRRSFPEMSTPAC